MLHDPELRPPSSKQRKTVGETIAGKASGKQRLALVCRRSGGHAALMPPDEDLLVH
ncbi:hypothetical protein [Amycolatopsis sp.]|uniref:hypothetical protein n=1 Tax=Amycolatopsis sp. TaxID=37632 RepID=UPI002E088EFE|nr:hypothetical protein [Amycolatopsis sp.]